MIFAETDRLILRSLEQHELPRLVELIGDWDVVRWLSVVPFPYTMRDGEEFYADMMAAYERNRPQFFAMAFKSDHVLIGGVGLHPPRNASHDEGQAEIGYWLGKDFWGQGLMSEAAQAVLAIGFHQQETRIIGANTDPDNLASQNVLRKIGMRNIGLVPRDFKTLRGGDQIIKWRITCEEWQAEQKT